jgi:hypothetical protein
MHNRVSPTRFLCHQVTSFSPLTALLRAQISSENWLSKSLDLHRAQCPLVQFHKQGRSSRITRCCIIKRKVTATVRRGEETTRSASPSIEEL